MNDTIVAIRLEIMEMVLQNVEKRPIEEMIDMARKVEGYVLQDLETEYTNLKLN